MTLDRADQSGRIVALVRGLRRLCPRCGRGRLYRKWYTLHERCSECGLRYEPQGSDTWAFMYLSTGGLTGAMIAGMLIIQPPSILVGQVVIGVLAVVGIVGTLPHRKGAGIALDYLTKHRTDDEERDG